MIIKLVRGSKTNVYDRVNHYQLEWEDYATGNLIMTRDGFHDCQVLSIQEGDDIFIMSEATGKTIDRIEAFDPDCTINDPAYEAELIAASERSKKAA